jgi:NAD(P)-dependent dehydrogenase (short-subunit alcohol dehydrogenase family)
MTLGHPDDSAVPAPERYATYPSIRDRVVLITGGASGIGASLVAHFCAQHARVAFIDVEAEPAIRLTTNLLERGLPAPRFFPCDLRLIDDLRRTVGKVSDLLGEITVLVNNAANDTRTASDVLDVETWDDLISVNLRPHFFMTQAVAPQMKRAGGGSIVNLGSVSAHADFVDLASYIAAKAGIEGLTRTLARELGPARIRVNCVVPGWIVTERQQTTFITDDVRRRVDAAQCLKYPLAPADVARLVLWLASDDSAAATGQRWVIDGGWL